MYDDERDTRLKEDNLEGDLIDVRMTKEWKSITKGEQACHHSTRVRTNSLESKWWQAFLKTILKGP